MKVAALAAWALLGTAMIARAEKLHNLSDYQLWVAFGFPHSESVDTYYDPNEGVHAKGWFKLPPRWSIDIPEGYSHVRVVYVTKRGHFAISPEKAMRMMYFPCTDGKGFDTEVRTSDFSGSPKSKERIEKTGNSAKLFFPLKAFYSPDHRAYACLASAASRNDLEKELKRP